MYSPLSDNFRRRIRESGTRKTVADVYYDGLPVATDLAVSDGNIRVDLEGQFRRSGNVTIADLRLVPTLSKTLSPHGTEILIRQGVVYPNGTEELVPLGVFVLEDTSWGEIDKAPKLQIYDRSKTMSQSGIASIVSRAGYNARAVVIEFLEWFYPSLAPIDGDALFDPGLEDYVLPGGHTFESGDYWTAIQDLCRNMGGDLHFDVTGQPRCTKIEAVTAARVPVETIDAGERGILVDANHSYSREGVYNAVSVVGAASEDGKTPSAVAYNLDGSSPLRYGGPFGKVILPISDTSLTTDAQCYKRAATELARFTGLAYSLDFSAIPNPALDTGDFIKVVYPDERAEIHQIASLSIPLGKGDYTGTSKGTYENG